MELGINKSFWIERSLMDKNVCFIFRNKSRVEIKCTTSSDGQFILSSSEVLSKLEIKEVKKLHKSFYFV